MKVQSHLIHKLAAKGLKTHQAVPHHLPVYVLPSQLMLWQKTGENSQSFQAKGPKGPGIALKNSR